MVHRAGAVAQVQHGRQAAGNVGLGTLHRGVQIIALGQVGRNGAGKGAAGAVGVGVRNALAVEPLAAAVPPQQVVGVVDLVAALAQHSAAVLLADALGRSFHPGGVGDGHAGEDLRLGDILGGKAQISLDPEEAALADLPLHLFRGFLRRAEIQRREAGPAGGADYGGLCRLCGAGSVHCRIWAGLCGKIQEFALYRRFKA